MGAEPHFNHNYGTGLEWYRLEPQVEVSDRNRSMRPPVQTLGHTVLFTTLKTQEWNRFVLHWGWVRTVCSIAELGTRAAEGEVSWTNTQCFPFSKNYWILWYFSLKKMIWLFEFRSMVWWCHTLCHLLCFANANANGPCNMKNAAIQQFTVE